MGKKESGPEEVGNPQRTLNIHFGCLQDAADEFLMHGAEKQTVRRCQNRSWHRRSASNSRTEAAAGAFLKGGA